jgi:hypothetical protein
MADEELARRLANLSAFQQELDEAGVGARRLANLSAFPQELDEAGVGAHRKPVPAPGLPRQLDAGQREAAYHAAGEAITKLSELRIALAGGWGTDAGFAAGIAEVVVPLETAAKEACRHD